MRSFVKVRGVNVPVTETFNQELMKPKAKLWMKFVCSRIWPMIEVS
ncbi:hypothetical protein Gogos_003436, partial [Gossypium gossypioides]|nr:hypothetical protein [Gossypium gossypioides]